ncbi:MAG: hypothetical protein ACYCPO_14925 [Acidobacteriaceae bacterium]
MSVGRLLSSLLSFRRYSDAWKQRPLLFHSVKGKLEVVPAVEGTGLARLGVGRGMAFGDLFNDGKIDAVIDNLDPAKTGQASGSCYSGVRDLSAAVGPD